MKTAAAAAVLMAILALAGGALHAMPKARLAPEEARKDFEAVDALLNKAYKEAMAGLDAAGAARLREAERDWIVYRDGMIAADFGDESATKHSADYWEAMAEYAKERAEFLRAWSGKNAAAGVGGKYSDSYGGALELKETKEGIEFSLSVVRGKAHNEGSIDGTLHREGEKAVFTQKLEAGQDGPPCELVFTFIGNHVVRIEEKTPDSLAGYNVHYDGDYYKIGKVAGAAASPAPSPAATAPPKASPAAAAEKPTVEQARKTFENTDNLLTAAYKEAGAGLDAAKMAELRQKERDWITYREMLAKSAPYFNGGAQADSPKGTVDYWQTMNEITRERVDFLRAYNAKGLPPGPGGVYSDSYGGTLQIEETKSGLAFTIKTVRGMARNSGSIGGIAQRTGDKAVFKDRPDAGDGRAPCEITFTFIEGHIVKVEEKNGDFYHGFNAGFDGLYYKTGKLEKPL